MKHLPRLLNGSVVVEEQNCIQTLVAPCATTFTLSSLSWSPRVLLSSLHTSYAAFTGSQIPRHLLERYN